MAEIDVKLKGDFRHMAPRFYYRAKTAKGEYLEGEVEALGKDELLDDLEKKGHHDIN